MQSYKIEVRRVDQTAVIVFQATYNLAGPPAGDVVRSSEFNLPKLNVSIPTSFELDMQFRLFSYDGLNATGNILTQSPFGFASHPSAGRDGQFLHGSPSRPRA